VQCQAEVRPAAWPCQHLVVAERGLPFKLGRMHRVDIDHDVVDRDHLISKLLEQLLKRCQPAAKVAPTTPHLFGVVSHHDGLIGRQIAIDLCCDGARPVAALQQGLQHPPCVPAHQKAHCRGCTSLCSYCCGRRCASHISRVISLPIALCTCLCIAQQCDRCSRQCSLLLVACLYTQGQPRCLDTNGGAHMSMSIVR
jgi:hypothetical protein